jgi:tetratricopeptide (TPR) repeat protein
MKNRITPLLGIICLFSHPVLAQDINLADAWKDPQFAKQFVGSFLPLTEHEPKISEKEAELFQALGELLAKDQIAPAIQQLTEALKGGTKEEPVSAALNYTLGNIQIQQGNFPEAIKQYNLAIKKFPNFRRSYKNLGLAYIQSGQYNNAIKSIVKAIELGDSSGDSFGLLAFSYLNADNAPAALEGYRQASLLNPNNKEWQIGKAEALMRSERYEEAIAQFQYLIEEMPDRTAFFTSISNAYLALEDNKAAALYLEILFRKGAASASALGLLGDIYTNEGLPALALEAYLAALKSSGYPNHRAIRTIEAFLQRGHYDQAETYMTTFMELRDAKLSEEESLELLNLDAQLALARGQDAEAAVILDKVLESDPSNGNALMLLGGFHRAQGDFEQAVFYFDRAVRISDYQREAQLQLARIFVQNKEYSKAIRELESALQLEYSSNVQDFLDAVKAVHSRAF